jgi:predicted DNA-binding WGR domain protein
MPSGWQAATLITVMNRSAVTDSKLSLDEVRFVGDHPPMSLYPYQLYCERIDRARNMARYYMLSIQPTLFGGTAVVRSWGRIGKPGGEMSELFETEAQAALRFLELARCKRRRGYRPAASCGNNARSRSARSEAP